MSAGAVAIADALPPSATFRDAMSRLASSAVAVTVRDEAGRPRGMLATAVVSYSAAPPSVLVSVAHSARTHAPLCKARRFGVHVLAREQADVAEAMAGKLEDKFAALAWTWDDDVPQLAGALAYLRCGCSARFAHHDHSIVVGDVETALLSERDPLVYFDRRLGWDLRRSAERSR